MTFIFPLFWKIHKLALLGIWTTFLLGVTLHYCTTRLQNVLLTMTQETRGKCRDKGYTANLISTFYEGRKVRVTFEVSPVSRKQKLFHKASGYISLPRIEAHAQSLPQKNPGCTQVSTLNPTKVLLERKRREQIWGYTNMLPAERKWKRVTRQRAFPGEGYRFPFYLTHFFCCWF